MILLKIFQDQFGQCNSMAIIMYNNIIKTTIAVTIIMGYIFMHL